MSITIDPPELSIVSDDHDIGRVRMKRQSCRFEPALTYFGPRVKEFERTFGHLARWSTWGR